MTFIREEPDEQNYVPKFSRLKRLKKNISDEPRDEVDAFISGASPAEQKYPPANDEDEEPGHRNFEMNDEDNREFGQGQDEEDFVVRDYDEELEDKKKKKKKKTPSKTPKSQSGPRRKKKGQSPIDIMEATTSNVSELGSGEKHTRNTKSTMDILEQMRNDPIFTLEEDDDLPPPGEDDYGEDGKKSIFSLRFFHQIG